MKVVNEYNNSSILNSILYVVIAVVCVTSIIFSVFKVRDKKVDYDAKYMIGQPVTLLTDEYIQYNGNLVEFGEVDNHPGYLYVILDNDGIENTYIVKSFAISIQSKRRYDVLSKEGEL